jgi:hypothetical protein
VLAVSGPRIQVLVGLEPRIPVLAPRIQVLEQVESQDLQLGQRMDLPLVVNAGLAIKD